MTDARITIRLTEAERKELEAAAASDRRSLSSYIVISALKEARERTKLQTGGKPASARKGKIR